MHDSQRPKTFSSTPRKHEVATTRVPLAERSRMPLDGWNTTRLLSMSPANNQQHINVAELALFFNPKAAALTYDGYKSRRRVLREIQARFDSGLHSEQIRQRKPGRMAGEVFFGQLSETAHLLCVPLAVAPLPLLANSARQIGTAHTCRGNRLP